LVFDFYETGISPRFSFLYHPARHQKKSPPTGELFFDVFMFKVPDLYFCCYSFLAA
jgi:hypothetical protein